MNMTNGNHHHQEHNAASDILSVATPNQGETLTHISWNLLYIIMYQKLEKVKPQRKTVYKTLNANLSHATVTAWHMILCLHDTT